MIVRITENSQCPEVSVDICCRRIDERIQRIVASLRSFDEQLVGIRDGETHIVPLAEALYMESVDGKTFLYTDDQVFEIPLRLYEVEERFADTELMRISKQTIINFGKVRAIKPDLNARLQLRLSNGEAVIASRQYAQAVKQRIGLA